ncbi:MAG: long-chain fatty acid--CoA ligase [Chloroflexi bacterium]|nr:long-chain fatty acid--CoA ligase [Chloroflexota bacterium]
MVMDRPWLRFYPQHVPPGLEYPRVPLYRLLQDAAARFPARAAILFCDGEGGQELSALSYRALNEESDRVAAALAALGIRKAERVAYFLQNSPELVASFYGILKAGAVAVPCNPMYRREELGHQLRDSGAVALITEPDLYPLVREVRAETPLGHVILTGGCPSPEGAHSFEALVRGHQPTGQHPLLDPMQDLALLPYTGGTTGVPKGAMLTHYNLVANAIQFARWYGYREGEEVFIAALPLFHIGGIAGVMTVPLAVGATIVLFRRFHARGVLRAVQGYRASRFLGVPTMYIAALNLEDAHSFDLSSLEPSRTGAAPLPARVKHDFDSLVGHEALVEGYGLTETSPLTHANPVHRARAGSIGVPLPDTDARIVDADEGTRVVPVSEVGELVLRGPQVMKGYWNKPEETAGAIRDGWFYTGDLARMDEEGYFYIVDRKKDMINAAGFKVWPREVEEVLYRHPQVRLAAVVGVPDAYRGETVKAVVVLKDHDGSRSLDALQQEIVAFCRRELAAYKVPRLVEFRDSLPISAAGKVLRRALRETPGGSQA